MTLFTLESPSSSFLSFSVISWRPYRKEGLHLPSLYVILHDLGTSETLANLFAIHFCGQLHLGVLWKMQKRFSVKTSLAQSEAGRNSAIFWIPGITCSTLARGRAEDIQTYLNTPNLWPSSTTVLFSSTPPRIFACARSDFGSLVNLTKAIKSRDSFAEHGISEKQYTHEFCFGVDLFSNMWI